jgi:hypothetical protein
MITRFGGGSSLLHTSDIEQEDVEGVLPSNASVGERQLYTPPSKDDELKVLRHEVHTLRQILYHKATYEEERSYMRFRRMNRSISTSTIANAINHIAGRAFGVGTQTIKLQPQFVFRLTYSIIETVLGSQVVRWEEKPAGLSKLKWLWRNNLLYIMPFAINAIEGLVHEMSKVDTVGTQALLRKLEQHLSKK